MIFRPKYDIIAKNALKTAERLYEMDSYKDRRIPDVSVGYAFFDLDEESAEDAVRRADEMMYRSKREKKAAVKV